MLVLLPPSETKASGGDGPRLRLDSLAHPDLTPVRRKLIDALVALAGDVPAGLAALGLSECQQGELERNASLWTTPTLPALRRYTGVLYAALDPSSLRPVQRARLVVASGLVVDLRSGGYMALAPVPGALTVQVTSEDGHGGRRTVSHHNKAHKGRLARLLATAPRAASDADGVARIARRGGLRVHRTGEHTLELVVPV